MSEKTEKFQKEYYSKHKFCPKCGSTNYSTTLMGFILDENHLDSFKDKNNCVCSNCGDKHTAHERV